MIQIFQAPPSRPGERVLRAKADAWGAVLDSVDVDSHDSLTTRTANRRLRNEIERSLSAGGGTEGLVEVRLPDKDAELILRLAARH